MSQNNTCECCGKKTNRVVQDHDHFNGLNRGKICFACNRIITEHFQYCYQQYLDYLQRYEQEHFQLMKSGSIPDQFNHRKKQVDGSKVIPISNLLTLCKYKQPDIKPDTSEVIPVDELLTRRFSA